METAEEYHARLGALLDLCGRPAICEGKECGASIWWLKTKHNANMPFDREGTPHWATCRNAEQFRRRE